MKNLMNNVDNVLTESLDGFAAAHADIVALGAEHEFVRRKRNKPGKVALISGGGAGHEPLHAGFVGHGMLDAACPGQIFTSPTPNQMMNAAQAVDGAAGVLFIVKNYSGDMMNFQMASDMLDQENAVVVVNDDRAYGTSGSRVLEYDRLYAVVYGSVQGDEKFLGSGVPRPCMGDVRYAYQTFYEEV